MELDERTKERINNYFNGVSSEQLFKLAVKYDIREAIEWGQTKGQSLPIDNVSKSFCNNCKSGLIVYPEINRRTCQCGALGYNVC